MNVVLLSDPQRIAQARRWLGRERTRKDYSAERRAENLAREWIQIDGEGWGEDELGRQCYKLLCAATASGFEDSIAADGERLHTPQILEWLCWLVPHYRAWCKRVGFRYLKPRISGYGLGYDYAHFLLDLGLDELKGLFHNQDHEAPWIEYEGFLLKLTAGSFQVKRMNQKLQAGYAHIWDTYRYFKGSFLNAAAHLMTETERETVEKGKARRGADSSHDLNQERIYALTECRIGSRLMKQLVEQADSLNLHPSSWYGPGSLAHIALTKQGVGNSYLPDTELAPELVTAARRAFVGGRFETTGHGRLPFLMQYDIRSAYPYAITRLPCLQHTIWEHVQSGETFLVPQGFASNPIEQRSGGDTGVRGLPDWSLLHVRWSNHGQPLAGGWGPWPARIQPLTKEMLNGHSLPSQQQAGDLRQEQSPLGPLADVSSESETTFRFLPVWPWSGESWIWAPEFEAGLKLLAHSPKASCEIKAAWIPQITCTCRPFDWVGDWYYQRAEYKAVNDPREYWMKVIINSLYGKFAQQVGRARWHSWLWAGMITSHTRAQLLEAIAQDPQAVVMTATDAVYSKSGLDLATGSQLGEWDYQALQSPLIVQSGFYNAEAIYDDTKPRTRGLPSRFIEWDRFQEQWDQILKGDAAWEDAAIVVARDPTSGRPFQIHVGIGLAQLWGKPEMMGRWLDYPTRITFKTDKRPLLWKDAPKPMRSPEWINTKPWQMQSNPSTEYPLREGVGIGEDKYLVIDQPNVDEWGYED